MKEMPCYTPTIDDTGGWDSIELYEKIHDTAVLFFKDMLSSKGNTSDFDFESIISLMISEDKNDCLCKTPTIDEVKKAVKDIHGW